MTITFSIDHLSTSVEDVSVEVAPKSEMTFQGITTDPKTGEMKASYVLASGDNAYPAIVTYKSALQSRASGQVRRIEIQFSTWATQSDSVSGLDTKKPVTASVVFTVPADMTIEVADLDDLLGNAFSFAYLSVTTKVRSTAWLQKLLYGASQVV